MGRAHRRRAARLARRIHAGTCHFLCCLAPAVLNQLFADQPAGSDVLRRPTLEVRYSMGAGAYLEGPLVDVQQ
jgi:hypothetical protein